MSASRIAEGAFRSSAKRAASPDAVIPIVERKLAANEPPQVVIVKRVDGDLLVGTGAGVGFVGREDPSDQRMFGIPPLAKVRGDDFLLRQDPRRPVRKIDFQIAGAGVVDDLLQCV